MDDGLPLNTITDIVQTPDGYIWSGLELGLARYDGVRFEVYDREIFQEWENLIILCLEVDSNGILWGGTRGGGVLRYKDGRFKVLTVGDGLLSNEVWAIEAATDGAIWVGTREGLNRIINGRIETVGLPDYISQPDVVAIEEDRLGRFWICTRNCGVLLLKPNVKGFAAEFIGLKDIKIHCVMEDRVGNLWFGTVGDGLIRFKEHEFSCITHSDGLSVNNIRCLYEDQAGNIWIGSYGGGINIIPYGQKSITVIDERAGLQSNVITCFYEDREGSLWFGTEGAGLNCLRDTKIKTYSKINGLSNNIIVGVFQDSRGYIWSGSPGFGVNRLNLKTDEIRSYSTDDGLGGDVVVSIAEAPQGVLWFGTVGAGVSRLDLKNRRLNVFNRANGLSDNSVRSLYTDSDGDLWAGTDSGGVHLLVNGEFRTVCNVNYRVTSLLMDRNGILWIGAFGDGMCSIPDVRSIKKRTVDGETVIKIKPFAGITPLDIIQGSDGLLWIGALNHGLFIYDPVKNETVVNIRKKNGLPDDMIYCIVEDDNHDFWMSTNRGIFYLNRKEALEFAAGKRNWVEASVYGTDDGMKSMECNGGNMPAGWKSHDGRIWFPTTKGLSVIDPGNLGSNSVPPLVVIESINYNDVNYKKDSLLDLPPGRGDLLVRYTALSFIMPKKVLFKYKLEGHDTDWVEAGNRRYASYNDLSPGTYSFRVVACNCEGGWNKDGDSFKFRMAPRFHQTAAFYIILSALVLSVAVLFGLLSRARRGSRLFFRKYKQSHLTADDSETYLQRIIHAVEAKKVYKDPNISLNTLSSLLMISPRIISQVINEKLKKNFFELINFYRIKEAQHMLADPEFREKSIQDISLEVGFNSRSAFNRVFKNFSGLTPSIYRKKNRTNDS